jgi:hypothetical protein
MIYRGNRAVLESAIILPEEHFFNGNKIRFDGLLTLLHEYSHIVLPDESRIFAMELLGIDDDMGPDEIDEFFADLVMTRISARLLLPSLLSRLIIRIFVKIPKLLLLIICLKVLFIVVLDYNI